MSQGGGDDDVSLPLLDDGFAFLLFLQLCSQNSRKEGSWDNSWSTVSFEISFVFVINSNLKTGTGNAVASHVK